MTRLNWLMLSRRKILSGPSNKLDLFGIFDDLKVNALPTTLPHLTLSMGWLREESGLQERVTYKVKMIYVLSGKINLLMETTPFELATGNRIQREYLPIPQLSLNRFGRYLVEIEQKKNSSWEVIGQIPFTIWGNSPRPEKSGN